MALLLACLTLTALAGTAVLPSSADAYRGGASSPINQSGNREAVRALLRDLAAADGESAGVQTGVNRMEMAAGRLTGLTALGDLAIVAGGSVVVWKVADSLGLGGFVYRKITGQTYSPGTFPTGTVRWRTGGSGPTWDTSGSPYSWALSAGTWGTAYCFPSGSFVDSTTNAFMHNMSGTEVSAPNGACNVSANAKVKLRTNTEMLRSGIRLQASNGTEFAVPPSGATTATAGTDNTAVLTDAKLDAALDEVGARDATNRTATDPDAEAAIDWINAHVDPTYSADVATTPNCLGLTLAACTSAYAAAGFTATPTHTTLTFTTADVSRPGGVVTAQSPPAGLVKPLTVPLTWTLNPPEEEMPVVIPEPGEHETERDYRKRLALLGLLGTFISTDELSDGDTDPLHGPNEVVRVNPRPGTRVHKGTEGGPEYDPDTAPTGGTEVTVVKNPASAPDATTTPDTDPGAGGSGFSPPAPPGIDLAPLSAIAAVGCSSFPFGIPCWTYTVVSSWVTSPVAPSFCMPFPYVHPDPCIDMSVWDPGMPVIRAMLLLMSFIGLGWLFMRAALGFGGGTEGED